MVTAARSVWSRVAEAASCFSNSVAPSNYVSLVMPLDHRAPARVLAVRDESTTTRTLRLDIGRSLPKPHHGQSLAVTTTVDGHFATRSYVVSSDPDSGDRAVEITVDGSEDDISHVLATDALPGDYVTVGYAH